MVGLVAFRACRFGAEGRSALGLVALLAAGDVAPDAAAAAAAAAELALTTSLLAGAQGHETPQLAMIRSGEAIAPAAGFTGEDEQCSNSPRRRVGASRTDAGPTA
jgi:hypothetical protein